MQDVPEVDSDLGYWAGGPVAVRVGKRASLFMYRCRLTCQHGTALLVQGTPPGDLPYIVDEADSYPTHLLGKIEGMRDGKDFRVEHHS